MTGDKLIFVIFVYFLKVFNIFIFQLNFLFALIMEEKKSQLEIALDMEMRNSNGNFLTFVIKQTFKYANIYLMIFDAIWVNVY